MGHDCSKVYDAAAEKDKETKAAKLINWTKIPLNAGFLTSQQFGVYNYEKYRVNTIINSSN